jgi:hypothetical protein
MVRSTTNPGIFALRARMLHHVREMKRARQRLLAVLFFCATLFAAPARAAGIVLPPEATSAMEKMYAGDPDAAIALAQGIERAQPQSPLGYLIAAEADWWKTYCAACEIKWGMVDAWKRAKEPEDDNYFALADKVVDLAEAQLAQSDTAEMHVYAGLGWALKARLYGLRVEQHNVAHTGVAARAEFVRALQLDPDNTDATAGMGFYNYYVDTLSSFAKVLRFFMGIPAGNKAEGIRQMKAGMEKGVFLAVDSRYYLARNLRTYDQSYEEALAISMPLAERYPRNPLFLMQLGNLNAELGHNDKAAEYFRAALAAPVPDATCAARVKGLATSFLVSLQ